MNLKNQKPIFVPRKHWAAMEKLSKAAMMDVLWDMAYAGAGCDETRAAKELFERMDIIVHHRKQAAKVAA
jgi:hypothetical protein